MKKTYFKGIMAFGISAMLLLSSCLKDSRYFNAETVPNLAELPLSGLQHFGTDAVTGLGKDTVTFAVGVTAANPPSSSTTVTLAVDNTIVTSYNAANPGIVYQTIPSTAFSLASTTVTIPAGSNSTLTTVIIDRTQLDPSLSYMLPVKIVSAGGLPISANYSVHYFHVIGNDFAGVYKYEYKRFNASDTTGTPLLDNFTTGALISPVSPTEFTMTTGYNGQGVRYDVTFTKTISGSTVSYSNWAVTFVAADVKGIWGVAGISVVTPPSFVILDPVKKTFRITYEAFNGSANRTLIDMYYK